MQIGVIAEEDNDVDVLRKLTCKLVAEHSFSMKKFVGHGCGKLRRKCAAWAQNLVDRGCSHLVVLHDLDQNDEGELRGELEMAIRAIDFNPYLILIPVHEIEAWLLSDAKAIQRVFNMAKVPKVPKNPEDVSRPKEKLRDIVWKAARKRYVNTIHNSLIASACSLSKVRLCRSFRPYPRFLGK